MTEEVLDFSGEGIASEAELEEVAKAIYDMMRIRFENPKDAGAALVLAHVNIVKAIFPPGYVDKAIDSIDSHAETVKAFVKEGYH